MKEEPEAEAKLNETEKAAENKTESEDKKANDTVKEAEKKPKVVTLKEPIESAVEYLTVSSLDGDSLKASIKKYVVFEEVAKTEEKFGKCYVIFFCAE